MIGFTALLHGLSEILSGVLVWSDGGMVVSFVLAAVLLLSLAALALERERGSSMSARNGKGISARLQPPRASAA